ncbi:hypothetical protein HK104_000806 [Borealophlyctis nickersoniae]|nr:hypothetical protein HK104_000806 [Borealophlyctis nickersoniae]
MPYITSWDAVIRQPYTSVPPSCHSTFDDIRLRPELSQLFGRTFLRRLWVDHFWEEADESGTIPPTSIPALANSVEERPEDLERVFDRASLWTLTPEGEFGRRISFMGFVEALHLIRRAQGGEDPLGLLDFTDYDIVPLLAPAA